MTKDLFKIAIIDLYDNEPNHGMRCIQELIKQCDQSFPEKTIRYDIFETRYKNEVPGLDYDIYLSSGGPGSPFDGKGKAWEVNYFNLINRIWNHNQGNNEIRKYVFFICHSFQMMCRFFGLGTIQERSRRSFGILPVNKTESGKREFLLSGLPDTYFAADFRNYEVVQPDSSAFRQLDAVVLSREARRIDPDQERALMAIRVSREFVGTQYHPEADPISMLDYFQKPDWKKQVVDEHGEKVYYDMISHLEAPDHILLTRRTILPLFLKDAIENISRQTAAQKIPA